MSSQLSSQVERLEPGRLALNEAMGPARSELRHATSEVHECLHRVSAFANLMQGKLTMLEYYRLLGRFFGFYHPLERSLRAVRTNIVPQISFAAREKSQLLYADLEAIGMLQSEIDVLPMWQSTLPLHSAEQVMGCLYVVEGAGLGGKLIARNLDDLLGRDTRAGRRFFLGRDPDPLPWSIFCGLLEDCSAQGNREEIIRSAQVTFEALLLWLSECDSCPKQ